MLCMGGIGASADAVKNGDSGIFHQMVMQSSSDPSADRPVSFAGAHDMEMMIDAVDAMVPINGRATFFVSVRGEQLRYQWQIGDLERGVWRDISAQDVDEIEGERTNTLCFRADETLEGTTAFRCLISDSLGHTVESAAAHLCIIPGDNNVIDAVKFGADGADSKDDSVAIQEALDFAGRHADEAHPFTVHLPDGKYYIDHTLIISSHTYFALDEGTELVYRGDNGCMLQGGVENDHDDYASLLDVMISGGQWDACASEGDPPSTSIFLTNATDVRLEGLQMRHSSYHSVMLESVVNAQVTGCTFRDSVNFSDEIPYNKEAVYIGCFYNNDGIPLTSQNVTVRDCTFENVSGGVGVRYCTLPNYTSEVNLQHCVFRGISAACLNVDGTEELTVRDCHVLDCGAFLYAFRTSGNVASNVINGTGQNCITLTGNCAMNVTDNQILNVGNNHVPSRIQSKGSDSERLILCSSIEVKAGEDARDRYYDRRRGYQSGLRREIVPLLNARTINHSSEYRSGKGKGIAIYFSDSTGSVTGNRVNNVDGRAIFVENSVVLTVIRGNTFQNVSGKDVYTCSSKVAVLENRYDEESGSVFIDPLSEDGTELDCYYQNDAVFSGNGVLMQPESLYYASAGQPMGFSVVSQGSQLRYQWYYRPDGSCFWSVWHGHTSATETAVASPFWANRQLCCVVTDGDGQKTVTRPTTILLRPSVILTGHPGNRNKKVGDDIAFSVDPFGIAAEFQWYYRQKNELTWTRWDAQTGRILSAQVTPEWDGVEVFCRVHDLYQQAGVDSAIAKTTVVFPIVILSHPESMTVDSGNPISFSVEAYGNNLKYRWYYKSPDAEIWRQWTDQTESIVQAMADISWNGREVYCVVSDEYGQNVRSRVAVVSVEGMQKEPKEQPDLLKRWEAPPRIVSQPQNMTVKRGEGVTVTAEGSGSDLQWQWYCQRTDASVWHLMDGFDTPTIHLSPDVICDGMQVRCEVTDGSGRCAVSQPARISVLCKPVILEQPQDILTQTGKKIVFSIKAYGTDLRYQWYRRLLEDTKWSVWKDGTTSTFEVTAEASWNCMEVCCVVTDRYGVQTTSKTVMMRVGDGPIITQQPQSISVPEGEKFTVSVGAKGDGMICQWYYCRPGSTTWTVWEGKNELSVSATANPSWDGMQVFCRVIDSHRVWVRSQTATIRVRQ